MSALRHGPLLLLLLAMWPAPVAAQPAADAVRRPTATDLVVDFATTATLDDVGRPVAAHLIFQDKARAFRQAPIAGFVNSTIELAFTVPSDTAAAIEAATSPVRIVVSEFRAGGDTYKNAVFEVPTAMALKADTPVWNRVTLTLLYAGGVSDDDLENSSRWSIVLDGQTHLVSRATLVRSGTAALLTLRLQEIPANGAKGTLRYRGTPVADVAAPATPSFTQDDPVGDADIYAAFAFTKGAGQSEVFATDLFFTRPFLLHATSRTVTTLSPKLSAKLQAPETGSEDAISLAAPVNVDFVRGPLPFIDEVPGVNGGRSRPFVHTITTSLAPKLEFDQGFDVGNVVLETQLLAGLRAPGGTFAASSVFKHWFVDVIPYSGFEFGHSFASVVPEADGTGVLRWKAGINSRLVFVFKKRPVLRSLVFEASYVLRYLFRDEVYVTEDEDELPAGTLITAAGETIVVPAGTLSRQIAVAVNDDPRQYLKLDGKLGVTGNFETFVSYAWGELPPKFKHVNKIQAGFAIRFNAPY